MYGIRLTFGNVLYLVKATFHQKTLGLTIEYTEKCNIFVVPILDLRMWGND